MSDIKLKNKMVTAEQLLDELFAPEAKPSLRWLRNQTKSRAIPFIKLGHLVFFDVEMVRTTLENKNLVRGRYDLRQTTTASTTMGTPGAPSTTTQG